MNNHKEHFNQPCEFAEQMISHLYGEAAETEKSFFDAHLLDCAACGEEFIAFDAVRDSILEWRAKEFEPLATPVFVVPSAENPATVSHSWLDSIRAFFAFSPAWATVIPILILVFGGLIFWSTTETVRDDSTKGDTIAEANRKMMQESVSESKKIENATANSPDNSATNNAATNAAPRNSVGNQRRIDAVKNDAAKADAPKDNVAPTAAASTVAETQSSPKSKKTTVVPTDERAAKSPVKTSNKINVPSLAAGDEEDDDLQLADLFEEVSLK